MNATLLRWQGGVKIAEYSIVVVYCAEEGIRMKPGLFVLAVLCLFAAATDGQLEKAKPRSIPQMARYYSGEQFLELNEANKSLYVMGLMDGFYASAFFGAADDAVAKLTSCTKDMDSKQVSAIITKYAKDHPEHWHEPLSIEAFNALNVACPGGLMRQ